MVVIGGSNVDTKARSAAPAVAATSNPGRVVTSDGGVGRNVAEHLARLGSHVRLLSAVGDDAAGDGLLTRARAAGIDVDRVLRTDGPTGAYCAVLDHDGSLQVAVSDMSAAERLDPAWLAGEMSTIAAASLVIIDANLRADTIAAALEVAAQHHVPVMIDPVSDAKAAAISDVLDASRPVFAITPNRSELAAITHRPAETDDELRVAMRDLHDSGVTHVWVSDGERGSIVSARSPTADAEMMTVPAITADPVDVTGAGDAMVAAFAHSHLGRRSIVESVRFAHGAAALAIESEATARDDISAAMIDDVVAVRHAGGTP